jgi:hypothetical protein
MTTTEQVTITAPDHSDAPTLTLVGRYAVRVTVKPDEFGDHENPLEEAPDHYGVIKTFKSSSSTFDAEGARRAIERDKDAVVVSHYEHGGVLWFVRGQGHTPPDMQWDGVWVAGAWIPPKADRQHCNGKRWKQGSPERVAYMTERATKACAALTRWTNNEYYGYVAEVFEARAEDGETLEEPEDYDDETPLSEDSCWGCDDFAYCVREALDAARGLLASLPQ